MLDREKVGNAIVAQRKLKGMTQKHLADLLNVSYQAVSRWEQGLSMPSVDMMYDIAQILDTSVDLLLNGLSTDKKTLTYMDTGLDTKRLHLTKDRLDRLVTQSDKILHAHYTDPVFFKLDTEKMEEPVCVFANHVPGSKERFAMKHGYDREICMDLGANAVNNLIRYGVAPAILQAHMLCGNNDSGQILTMGEAFREFCEANQILFAGMEVGAQAVNYRSYEYKTGAVVIGIADRKNILTGAEIVAGDVIIGLHTDGIYATSYPFVKLILDKKPDILYAKIDEEHLFMDELMKPNTAFVKVIHDLNAKKLAHGIFNVYNSVLNPKNYRTIPKGLGACICANALPLPPLFRYLYHLDMINQESFLRIFSLGLGMLVVVPKAQCDRAVKIIAQYHPCSIIGRIEKNDARPGKRVWMEGDLKW